jgi:tetratricopeptide (TPR) repeat protein
MRLRLINLACSLTLLAAWPAAAADDAPKPYVECTSEPTEGDVAAAKGAFQAGQASFNEADYNRAITYWEDAYRRDCTAHALLLNLARAYELNAQKRMAVNSLETFLARNPSTPQRDQIARRIEVLNEKIATEGPAAAVGPVPVNGTPGGPSGTGPGTPTTPPDSGGGSRPLLPLLVAGGGGVIAVVGTVLYLGAKSDEQAAEDKCPSRKNCPEAIQQEGNDAVKRADTAGVITIAGVAIAAGGVAWYFLSEPEPATVARALPKKRAPQVSPTWSPGYAGLSVSGAF